MRLSRLVNRWQSLRPATARPPAVSQGGMPAGLVYAVRRDWADGTHDFIGPRHDLKAAATLWDSQYTQWRAVAYRPQLTVVLISSNDFRVHALYRPDCAAPDCPAPFSRAPT